MLQQPLTRIFHETSIKKACDSFRKKIKKFSKKTCVAKSVCLRVQSPLTPKPSSENF